MHRTLGRSGCLASVITFLLLVTVGAMAHSIRAIYLANADATPPVTPAAPTGASTICAAPNCVTISAIGSFVGTRLGSVTPKTSVDGTSWTTITTNPFVGAKIDFVVSNSRWLTPQANCSIWYSDDQGTSWTEVDLSATLVRCFNSNTEPGVKCASGTCYIAGGSSSAAGSFARIMVSTNNGTSWSLNYTGANGGYADCAVLYYASTDIVVTCDPINAANPTRFYTSTDNGGNWNAIVFETNIQSYRAVTKLGSTWYTVRASSTAPGAGSMRSSTDLASWSAAYLPTFDTSWTTAAPPLWIEAYNNYSNPTMYFCVNNGAASNRNQIYTSENGTDFTQVYASANADGGGCGNFIQDDDSTIYFGSTGGAYFRIS